MLRKETHREPIGFRGHVERVVSAGFGTPYARPTLTAWTTLGFAPEGVDLVTSPAIAVGIDKNGYLVPAGTKSGNDGQGSAAKELVKPYGIIGFPLRGMKKFMEFLTPKGQPMDDEHLNAYPGILPCMGQLTGAQDLHSITPTVYQESALFQRGYAYDTTKTGYTALFEFAPGDLLRPIHEDELAELINQDVILPLFGETKADCPKTKAYFAGMLVKFGAEITGKSAEAQEMNKPEFKCARVAAVQNAMSWNNIVYAGNDCFDYEIQGRDTNGASINVWNSISSAFENKALKQNFKAIAVEFYVTM